jgi:hypothetical protein
MSDPAAGFLTCPVCHRVWPLGDVAAYERTSWPKHCGVTLTWTVGHEGAQLNPRPRQ